MNTPYDKGFFAEEVLSITYPGFAARGMFQSVKSYVPVVSAVPIAAARITAH